MNDDAPAAEHGDDDGDHPIPVLQDFSFAADPEFRSAVRRGIDRRLTGGELMRLSTQATLAVVLEFLSLGRSLPAPPVPGSTDEE